VPNRLSELAASIGGRSRIKDPNSDEVRKSGEKAAEILATEIMRAYGKSPQIAVLDFGAAAGRVTVPLARLLPRSRVTATDVDAESIEYLQLTAPANCAGQVNAYVPPLPFAPGTFDCVVAISVWSHFPDDLSVKWLKEMQRITKPGALLLISTGGETTLEEWRKTPRWAKVSVEQYQRDKYIYLEYKFISSDNTRWPGIAGAGSWGETIMHPEFIREHWGRMFDVLEVRQKGTPGSQDLVIMRSPRQ
jgi:SAM-dependent methyltransferase